MLLPPVKVQDCLQENIYVELQAELAVIFIDATFTWKKKPTMNFSDLDMDMWQNINEVNPL